jgi:hypothetical protein
VAAPGVSVMRDFSKELYRVYQRRLMYTGASVEHGVFGSQSVKEEMVRLRQKLGDLLTRGNVDGWPIR